MWMATKLGPCRADGRAYRACWLPLLLPQPIIGDGGRHVSNVNVTTIVWDVPVPSDAVANVAGVIRIQRLFMPSDNQELAHISPES